jgi:hypothetical protein
METKEDFFVYSLLSSKLLLKVQVRKSVTVVFDAV